MDWHDKIAADWPAPRDDEPSSLRQDIADELADHLACALNRERHSTPDAKQAEQKVLNRFGDPARVARKLWLDEMWEKIMLQRATLAITAIMAAAVVAACVLLAMVLQQNRTVNEAILQKLANLPAPAAELKSLEWNRVKVHLVAGKQGGPPAKGFRVSLQGNLLGQTGSHSSATVEKTTDKNGLADLGLVRPGTYTLVTTSPWWERMMKEITVRPGRTEPFEVVCPAEPLGKSEVAITVDWPDDLKSQKLWLACDFTLNPRKLGFPRKLGAGYWSVSSTALALSHSTQVPGGRSLFLSPSHTLAIYRRFRQGHDLTQLRIQQQRLEYPNGQSLNLTDSVQWEQGRYALLGFIVMQPIVKTVGASRQTTLSVGEAYRFRGPGWSQINAFSLGSMAGSGMSPAASVRLPPPSPTFRVVAGKPNHWTIPLPDDLVQRVRARLAGRRGQSGMSSSEAGMGSRLGGRPAGPMSGRGSAASGSLRGAAGAGLGLGRSGAASGSGFGRGGGDSGSQPARRAPRPRKTKPSQP